MDTISETMYREIDRDCKLNLIIWIRCNVVQIQKSNQYCKIELWYLCNKKKTTKTHNKSLWWVYDVKKNKNMKWRTWKKISLIQWKISDFLMYWNVLINKKMNPYRLKTYEKSIEIMTLIIHTIYIFSH